MIFGELPKVLIETCCRWCVCCVVLVWDQACRWNDSVQFQQFSLEVRWPSLRDPCFVSSDVMAPLSSCCWGFALFCQIRSSGLYFRKSSRNRLWLELRVTPQIPEWHTYALDARHPTSVQITVLILSVSVVFLQGFVCAGNQIY